MLHIVRGRSWMLVWVLLANGACGGSSTPKALPADAAAPGADAAVVPVIADAASIPDVAPDVSIWPDVPPGTLPMCNDIPDFDRVLLAGAFVSLWMTPAPATTPTGTFEADISGVLSVDVPSPTELAVFTGAGSGQRFAVQAQDGRRLTIAYEVQYGRVAHPLSGVLEALAGKAVSLRFVARARPDAAPALAFVAADRDGLAFAFDSSLGGHALLANDLGGLSVQPGRPRCSLTSECAADNFLSLQIAGTTDVEVPPSEERTFTFGGRSYVASNIRHNQPPPGCTHGAWSAWALWRQ